MPLLMTLEPEVSLIRGPFRACILSGTRIPSVIDANAHSPEDELRHAVHGENFASNGDNTPIRVISEIRGVYVAILTNTTVGLPARKSPKNSNRANAPIESIGGRNLACYVK